MGLSTSSPLFRHPGMTLLGLLLLDIPVLAQMASWKELSLQIPFTTFISWSCLIDFVIFFLFYRNPLAYLAFIYLPAFSPEMTCLNLKQQGIRVLFSLVHPWASGLKSLWGHSKHSANVCWEINERTNWQHSVNDYYINEETTGMTKVSWAHGV